MKKIFTGRNRRLKLLLAGALLLFSVQVVWAELQQDALLDLLIKKGTITKEEAGQVKAEWDKQLAAQIEKQDKMKVAKWIDAVKWSGDLRLRAEYFDFEDSLLNSPDRLRFRARLRLGAEWKFHEWAAMGVRVATGEKEPGDPGSTNQTFTDTFSRKSLRLNLAYVTLQPPDQDWIKVTGGKMNNPLWQTSLSSPLEWDHDVTPEGLAEQFASKFGDKKQHSLFANFGQFAVEEFSKDSNDVYVFLFQGGVETKIDTVKAKVAGGYTLTQNLDMLKPGDSPNLGNATGPGGTFLDDFEVASARAEVTWTARKEPLLGTPCVLTFSGEYLKNLANAYKDFTTTSDSDQTDAFAVQLAFGEAKKKGQWQLAYHLNMANVF